MKNIKNNILQEQTDDNLDFELGMQMSSLGPIPKTKKQAAAVIKRIFNSSNQPFYKPGDNMALGDDLQKVKDKIRFFEYGKSFHDEKEGRGFNFEGMLAGLFDGDPIISKAKEDIIVNGVPYSVKSAEDVGTPSFDSGTLIPGLRFVKETLEFEYDKNKRSPKLTPDSEKRWEEEYDITTPKSLLDKKGEEWNDYKEMMLDFSFTSSDGKPLKWIFALIEPNSIKYTVWTSEALIHAIITAGELIVGVGRAPLKDIRLKSDYLFSKGDVSEISFPEFTSDQLKRLRYNPDRGLKIDKIAELFGKYKTKIRHDVLKYIRKNPTTFLKRVVNLYGDRLGPMLKDKGYVELNESINYDDVNVQNAIIDILHEGVGGDQEWHTKEQGDFFTMSDSENLGSTDIFKGDGFDIIHQYMGDVHLSDLSPEEEETVIPKGDKKVKKTVLKPILNKGAFNIKVNEGTHKGHYGHVFSDTIPLELDNKLYVLSNRLGGITHEDIKKFIENTNRESLYMLQGLLRDFPSSLEDLIYYYGSLDFLKNSADYKRIVSLIKRVGSGERITEESDVFGQGLLDPIEPEEFEGSEEEWEKLMSDVENDPAAEPEPEYEYTGGKTDPAKGFVAPSKEVTDNICTVEGFCNAQGPITFGQLKALVEQATSKRIQADMGRGLFKTAWRIIPFFIPQILLAAVGITVTRAINKIITPALTDTRGYKEWWGKVVLKAMDIAEGDYVPDITLGDDPLSKVFFISDGLMQMIRDKYKLKFARYVADYAAARPDDEPVPDWFVENLLRDYLNQKFLLDPPLPVKDRISVEIEEDLENWGYRDNKIGVVKEFDEEGYKKGQARLQQTINNYLDSEYEIKLINYPGGNLATRFESNRNGEMLNPRQIIKEIQKLFGGGDDGALYYLKYLTYKREQGEDISFLVEQERDPTWTSRSATSFRRLHRDRVNDDNLTIPPATLVSYLNKYHREKLIKDLTPLLECIEYNCYVGPDIHYTPIDSEEEETAIDHCEGCGEELTDILGGLDKELIKLGFLTGGGPHDVLQKPFPFTYNDWFEGVIQEINPKFYINDTDDVAYMKKETQPITEQQGDVQEHNPDVEVGDVIELIYMDDPWGVSPMTRGVVMGFEDMGGLGEKILVKWIVKTEEGEEKFRELPLIKHVDYWRVVQPLTEHITPTDDEERSEFDYDRFSNLMVKAYFNYGGGWGQPPKRFVVYITPSGIVKGVSLNVGMTNRDVPFKEGDKVSLGDLIKFERNSKFDLQMKGRIREEVINEQVSISQDDQQKMTPTVWKIIQMAMKLGGRTYGKFQNALVRYFNLHENDAAFLWLLLTANAKRLEISTPEVLQLNYNEIEVPELWESEIEFNDDYVEEDYEDDCDEGGGYGAESGEECQCYEYEEIEVTRKEEDGEEYTEYVDCFGATDEELKENGYDDKWECSCEDWETMYYKRYHYPTRQAILLTHEHLGDKFVEVDDYTYHDIVHELNDWEGIVTDDDHYDDNYAEAESWDYFNDDEEGYIRDWGSDRLDTESMMYMINQNFYKESPLFEQKEKQLKMWPTGHFNYPVAHLDDEEIKHVEDSLPDNVVEMVFRQWDKKGIDFSIFKMLGIDEGVQMLAVMLLKRYIQFSQNPLPASYTFDCGELVNLFDTNHRDYEMGYIKEYLCGDDSFWDHEDWYNYEWDDYMTDQIDEGNWKTISEIFGGVSQSVAEDMLNRSSSSEEVDELTEKYEEEIDEIRDFIVWAHNDEAEWAIKKVMSEDITDKIGDHFNGVGRLIKSDSGNWSYVIEDDLRNWINDKWDNTEDTFEFHPDYINQTIESILLNDATPNFLTVKNLFSMLIQEEYGMHEYCEGKRGECLQAETKWFDGYYFPDYDINESLQDRLGELTYQKEAIQEQTDSGRSYVQPDEPHEGELDETPFTKLDVNIMNRLAKMFPREEVRAIWEEAEDNLGTAIHTKFVDFIKLFGEDINTREGWAKATRFAKWADDNWRDAENSKEISLGDDFDPTITYDLDFGVVTNPVKEWPSLYNVEATEHYWVKEYRYGEGEFAGYGEEDARDKAEASWWEYDIDMEYGDQGDTDDHDMDMGEVDWIKSLKEARIGGLLHETGMLKEMQFDKNEILRLAKNTKGGIRGGRGDVFRYLTHLRDSGLVNMFQSPDFLWSGKEWLMKYLDFKHPERLENPDENIQYLLDNANRVRDILIILLMDRADREGTTPDLDNFNREIKPLARDLVKIWSVQI